MSANNVVNFAGSDLNGDELRQRALAIPLEPVKSRLLANAGIELLLRRDDLIDEQISGNKFYKLFYNLIAAKRQGYRQLLSFGGAYSNHLHALAAAGSRYGFQTVGIVRGERPDVLSATLQDAEAWGMRLVFVSRDNYRVVQQPDVPASAALKAQITADYGSAYWIPEGGANLNGALGMKLLGEVTEQQLNGQYTALCLACGTGTSLAGVAAGITPHKLAVGFSVLKGDGDLGVRVASTFEGLISPSDEQQKSMASTKLDNRAGLASNWRVISGYHAGGYGKKHPDYLYRFWQEVEQEAGIALDPVYTVKLLWGITRLAQQGYWPKGARLVAVHTGGLQGRRGFRAP